MQSNQGTYVGAKYTDATTQQLSKLMKIINVPNAITKDKLHSTLLYSKKEISIDYGTFPIDYMGWTDRLEIWEDQGKNILVLIINSDEMKSRHDELLEMGGASVYPEFNQHITLSYDVQDWIIPECDLDFNVFACTEYIEPLKLSWS